MNIYRTTFIAECPNNGQQIVYELEIQSDRKIMVEHITTACRLFRRGYHEDIADALLQQLGQRQILKANHHGVHIETVREVGA